MFLRIVSVMFPLFAIAGVGYAYGRLKKPDMRLVNQLNMDVFVPALVFSAMASKSFDFRIDGFLAIGAAIVVLGSGLLALPVARCLNIHWKVFLPPAMFNNSGNIGLPLAVLAFGEQALPAAVMLFIAENTLHYGLGTWMLNPKAHVLRLWKEPVIFASIVGLLFNLTGVVVWEPLLYAMRMVGDMAMPLLLFALGVRLVGADFSDIRLGVICAVVCSGFGVLCACLAGLILPLTSTQQAMLIVFGSLPPAVLNYVFAEKYHVEPPRVASMVMVGNLLGLVFIPLALWWVL